MAKQRTRVVPARKPAASRDDDSLLTRSAESLDRVVGSLRKRSGVAESARAGRKTGRARKPATRPR